MMTKNQEDKGLTFLFARLDDLHRSADRGILGGTSFLSPRDLHFAKRHLTERGMGSRTFEWGGYADAERKRLYILPEYVEDVAKYNELLEYGFESDMGAVEIVGSGYRSLSHRDFLGSVLGLGLDRDVIGDILVYQDDKPRAVIICDVAVRSFVCEALLKVGSDTVRTRELDMTEISAPERRLLHVSDTVASPRLDSVVSSLLSISREKAKMLVSSGAVQVDYETCEHADKMLSAPCIVTVSGAGKFCVNSLCDKTKKGRIRLDADKYV